MVKRTRLAAIVIGVLGTCLGCGDRPPPGTAAPAPAPSMEDAVRARLTELLALAEKGDAAAAAGYVVYRGPDEARKWKDVCDYTKDPEKTQVDSVLRRIAEIRKAGPLVPDGFERKTEGEGEWLALKYKAGDKPVLFAFLAVKGTYALGDID